MGGDGGEAMSDTGHRHGRQCWVSASSGIPPQQALFNGSACAPSHPLLQMYSRSDAARKLAMHTQVCPRGLLALGCEDTVALADAGANALRLTWADLSSLGHPVAVSRGHRQGVLTFGASSK